MEDISNAATKLNSMQLACMQPAVADDSMLALSTALQHPALSTDPRVLCAAAQACKAWREAVRQCSACNTVIFLKPEATLPQLCSFTQWLAKHALLVMSITAVCGYKDRQHTVHGLPWEQHVAAAQQLLQQALQLAALQPVIPAAAATPAPVATALQQQQQQLQQQQAGLCLARFTSDCFVTSDVLAALPAHSLTHLDVGFTNSKGVNGPAVAAALAHLSSLQQLSLCSDDGRQPVAGSCLLGLAQLKQLTSLTLRGSWSNAAQPLQQLLAQPLQLRQLYVACTGRDMQQLPALDMSALSTLQEMRLTSLAQLPEGSVLPPQLTQLQLHHGAVSASNLSMVLPLQQLQRLGLTVTLEQPQLLLRLAQLPALQHLALTYNDDTDAAATATAWPQLPQLCDLTIGGSHGPDRLQMEAVLAGIAGSTSLTMLRLELRGVDEALIDDDGEPLPGHRVAACAHLTGLQRLKHLTIASHDEDDSWLQEGDALALTALTGLTSLILRGHFEALGNLEATALACNLQQLQHVDLSYNELGDLGCLAAIAKLTQLTSLDLSNGYEINRMTQRGLMMLTTLSRVQCLELAGSSGVTAQRLDAFWAAMRGQQRQQRAG